MLTIKAAIITIHLMGAKQLVIPIKAIEKFKNKAVIEQPVKQKRPIRTFKNSV